MNSGLATILAAAAVSAIAYSAASGGADPSAFAAPLRKREVSAAGGAAFLDARIAALHAGLRLSPEQEKLWPGVAYALRTAAQSAMESYQKLKNAPAGVNLTDQMRQRGENAALSQNFQVIADAASPLYASLSEEQRRRLPALIRGLTRQLFRHQFAMTGRNREYWRRHWGEQGGMVPNWQAYPRTEIR